MHSDMRHEHPLFRLTPPKCHPYIKIMRLDRPIGIWLLLLPCWWGLALAEQGILSMDETAWRHAWLFALGAVLMRSAGCIINDLWDMRLDAQVERTMTRPLPAGDITRKQALALLAVLLAASLGILLCLSKLAVFLGFGAVLLVITYPLMKRITWWPQAFLGLTFNWGILMAWADSTGKLGTPAFLLYAGGVFWTLAYDTIYAHQDKKDDARIGVMSTALRLGDDSRKYVAAFFGLAFLCILIAKYAAFPSIMTVLLLVPPAFHAFRQVTLWDMNDAQSCLAVFKSNRTFGLLVLLMQAL